MLIIKDEDQAYHGEILNFSLLGVVDVPSSLELLGQDEVFDFLLRKHPSKQGNLSLKPLWVRNIKKSESGQALVFAFFVATKECNPKTDRALPSEESLACFRSNNPIVEFNENWNDWSVIIKEKS